MQVCTNEKNFTKRYRWCITNNIVEKTTEICRKIVRAHAIRVGNIDDYNRRTLFQKEAYELTEVLLEDIDTVYTFFHLTSNRVEYWIAIIGGYEMKDIDVILLDKKLAIEEAKNERLKANQDYIAMMTDVEIPEEEDHE